MTMYAFPSGHNPKTGTQESGMTLRDYFAGRVMEYNLKRLSEISHEYHLNVARNCYLMADAMLKARDE